MKTVQRAFTSEDQLAFARLSGDYNPLHVDPIAARRLIFGAQVVHGLHALLWSLDRHLGDGGTPLKLRKVKAVFQAGVGVGQKVIGNCCSPDEGRVEIQLETAAAPAAWIQIGWETSGQKPSARPPLAISEQLECRERSIDEVAAAKGTLPLYLDDKLAEQLLPNLARLLPPLQLSGLLATTRLVGMECPGRHSIFSGLDLSFVANGSGPPQLDYQVANCNKKLSLLMIKVKSPGMRGDIKAFFRPPPQRQETFRAAGGRVKPEEFSAQRAIIVGGSRGLGEAAAKLLAAGGAEVIITYCHGEQDALRIVEEIVSNGAKADSRRLNVLSPPDDLLRANSSASKPLYLYYFATPYIFGTARGKFSSRRFNTFCGYYVTGFLATVEKLMGRAGGLEKIFFPSTTAIDELPPDMGEYASAKAAGELLCDFLQKTNPGLTIYKPRLPRLATDQTVSLLPANNQEPLSVLLPHLRHLRDL